MNSIGQALQSQEFAAGDWPEETWWEQFNDPQLNALIVEGLQNSPDLKQANAHARATASFARQIKAKLYPYFNAHGSDNWEHLSKFGFERYFAFHSPPASQLPPIFQGVDFTQFAVPVPAVLQVLELGLDMNWSLDFFGKNYLRFESALGRTKAQKAEAMETRLQVSSQIAQAYFSLQVHWAIVEIHHELLELRKNLNTLTSQRLEGGLDTRLDSLATMIDLSAAEKLIYDLEETVALDRHRLFVLMGLNPDVGRKITPSFSPLESILKIPDEISSNLLGRRPDLMAAIWRVEKSALDVGVAKREFYPEINLKALCAFRSVVPDDLFHLSAVQTSLYPAFNLPIFHGGELRANLREKIASFEEAAYSYKETLLHALQEVADILSQLEFTGKSIAAQQDILKDSLERQALTQEQYAKGYTNYYSFLKMQLETLNQKGALLTLQSNQLILAVKLMQALGGGYNASQHIPEKFLRGDCEAD